MIFVTVGTELPFNRLVKVIDAWAAETQRKDVFAQLGNTDWAPSSIAYAKVLDAPQFAERFRAASVIVSHAGMGTILSALNLGKPILVMPRLAAYGEHRNDHQLATAKRMSDIGSIHVAFDEHDLRDQLATIDALTVRASIGACAGVDLLTAIRDFTFQNARR